MRPNCVCSDEPRAEYHAAPLQLSLDPEEAWRILVEEVRSWPRCRVVTCENGYLHAEVRTRLLRFVDDFEAHLRPADGVVAVRSASRTGYSDLAVNRRRVEHLRNRLRGRGVVS